MYVRRTAYAVASLSNLPIVSFSLPSVVLYPALRQSPTPQMFRVAASCDTNMPTKTHEHPEPLDSIYAVGGFTSREAWEDCKSPFIIQAFGWISW